MIETGAFPLRYDPRAPALGAPAEALYRAALEQCAWAEEHGFLMATLSEHHGADDGYCSSPLVMAAAIAGRTRNLRLMIAAPSFRCTTPSASPRTWRCSTWRAADAPTSSSAPATARRSWPCSAALDDRIPLLEEGIEVLRNAWTGEEFTYRGRRGP